MLDEQVKHIEDYYSHEVQSYVSWNHQGKNLRKKFVIEYCDDEEKLEKVGHIYPWGVFEWDDAAHKIIFEEDPENLGSFEGVVMSRYLSLLFNPKVCAVKLWEEIYDGNESVQERWIEFPSTFMHSFKKRVAEDVTRERDELRKTADALAKEMDVYLAFINKYNVQKTFNEFRKEYENGTHDDA